MNTKLKPHKAADRIYLFDNVKWLAIVMVVVGHAIGFLTEASKGNQLEKNLFVIIYSVHMPLFIFISGLFIKPMDKDTKIPKDKIIAFIAIGIVLRAFTAILRILLGKHDYFYSVMDMYDSYTWFMGAIAVMIFLTWLFRAYSPKIVFPVVLLVGCMIVFAVSMLCEKGVNVAEEIMRRPFAFRLALYAIMLILPAVLGQPPLSEGGFIYAQF